METSDLALIPESSRRTRDDVNVIWEPMAGYQELFLTCMIFECLGEGTRGGGKTDTLLMDFAQHTGPDRRTPAEKAAGMPQTSGWGAAWNGIIFRQTYKQLNDLIKKTKKWFPLMFPEASYNHTEHAWTWPTGEVLLLRQFKREEDYWNYHGHEYPWIAWEELCNWPDPSGYKRMMTTCRSTVKGMPRKYRATTNPYGPGHNWVKHRFQLPSYRNRVIRDSRDDKGNLEPARIALFSSLADNKHLIENDPDYIKNLIAGARNEAELQAWLYGSWDIVAGGMFDDVWSPSTHILPSIRPKDIPKSWRIDRSFDWGSSRPFSVAWWAESDGSDLILPNGQRMATVRGDLFRIQEWYGWTGKPNEGVRMTAEEVTEGIIERELEWGIYGRVHTGVADAQIFASENNMCIATDMARSVRLENGKTYPGIQWYPADKSRGSRKAGWEKMRLWLKQAMPSKKTGLREKPGIFVMRCCKHFIRTVPVLSRSDIDLDDIAKEMEDHAADETRYRVRNVLNKAGNRQLQGNY